MQQLCGAERAGARIWTRTREARARRCFRCTHRAPTRRLTNLAPLAAPTTTIRRGHERRLGLHAQSFCAATCDSGGLNRRGAAGERLCLDSELAQTCAVSPPRFKLQARSSTHTSPALPSHTHQRSQNAYGAWGSGVGNAAAAAAAAPKPSGPAIERAFNVASNAAAALTGGGPAGAGGGSLAQREAELARREAALAQREAQLAHVAEAARPAVGLRSLNRACEG
jgi:hypothetical protein